MRPGGRPLWPRTLGVFLMIIADIPCAAALLVGWMRAHAVTEAGFAAALAPPGRSHADVLACAGGTVVAAFYLAFPVQALSPPGGLAVAGFRLLAGALAVLHAAILVSVAAAFASGHGAAVALAWLPLPLVAVATCFLPWVADAAWRNPFAPVPGTHWRLAGGLLSLPIVAAAGGFASAAWLALLASDTLAVLPDRIGGFSILVAVPLLATFVGIGVFLPGRLGAGRGRLAFRFCAVPYLALHALMLALFAALGFGVRIGHRGVTIDAPVHALAASVADLLLLALPFAGAVAAAAIQGRGPRTG